jgi:hypothetical protein
MIIEERLQRALERIYTDPALTDALRDPEAKVLLDWAQQQVQCLVAETDTLDEEIAWSWLSPRLRQLRRTVRRIARHSGDAEAPLDAVRRRLSLLAALKEEATGDEN